MQKYKTVDEFLRNLDDERRSQVEILRQYIMDEMPSLTEHIKWNAPSYAEADEDRVTFNTMNKEQVVKLVFHMGVARKEKKGGQPILENAKLVEWVSDIRGYITFKSMEEITSNELEIKRIVREWVALP